MLLKTFMLSLNSFWPPNLLLLYPKDAKHPLSIFFFKNYEKKMIIFLLNQMRLTKTIVNKLHDNNFISYLLRQYFDLWPMIKYHRVDYLYIMSYDLSNS